MEVIISRGLSLQRIKSQFWKDCLCWEKLVNPFIWCLCQIGGLIYYYYFFCGAFGIVHRSCGWMLCSGTWKLMNSLDVSVFLHKWDSEPDFYWKSNTKIKWSWNDPKKNVLLLLYALKKWWEWNVCSNCWLPWRNYIPHSGKENSFSSLYFISCKISFGLRSEL